MTAASYKSTISADVLHVFVLAGLLSAAKVSELTEEMLADAIMDRAIVDASKYDLGSFEAEVSKLCVEKTDNCHSVFNQVCTMVLKYKKLLTSHGSTTFLDKQVKISVQHALQILPHTVFRKRMELTLRLRKDEFKANFTAFILECVKEAEEIDHQDIARHAEDPRTEAFTVPAVSNSVQSRRSFLLKKAQKGV